MNKSQKLGAEAEQKAKDYLRAQGYEILQTNYRNKLGEIDIIAKEQSELVFVEVKALSRPGAFDPMDHIDRKKQKKLIQMAQSFTASMLQDIDQRIDIILVYCNTKPWKIDHYKDAINQ